MGVIGASVFAADTFLGRLARLPLRVLPRTATMPILQGELKGIRWIVGSQRHAFWLGTYEPALQSLIAATVKPGSVFYDVGANVGFYSLLASRLVCNGHVYAFEPLPANVSYLRRHLLLNKANNVEVIESAISDHCGFSRFSVEDTGAMGRLETGGTLTVKASSLDELVAGGQIRPPDYIKMDIEGEESKALQGARICLLRFKPTLFLATHGESVHQDCCAILSQLNYSIRLIDQSATDRAEMLAVPQL